MDVKVANLSCKACGVAFQARIHALSEPIDVYHEWVDACEEANAAADNTAGARAGRGAVVLSDDEA